jgi:hypothetical protein
MIFINEEFYTGNSFIGPWTTDQEIKAVIQNSKQDLSFDELAELRTACLESLAQADANFRSPFTVT